MLWTLAACLITWTPEGPQDTEEPPAVDSDQDGWPDELEEAVGSDPEDCGSVPVGDGQWANCRQLSVDWEEEGWELGQRPPNWSLMDQYGRDLRLYDFASQVTVIQISAMWCGACEAASADANVLMSPYDDEGVVLLTLLTENKDSEPPTRKNLKSWSEDFNLGRRPVTAQQVETEEEEAWRAWNVTGLPVYFVLDRELRLVGSTDDGSLEDLVALALD